MTLSVAGKQASLDPALCHPIEASLTGAIQGHFGNRIDTGAA